MRVRPSRAVLGSLLTVVGFAALACTGDPKGQLMVAVQTDMSVPDDINTLRIEVRQFGGTIAKIDNEIRPFSSRGIFMPGTLGLVEGSDPGSPVEIRVSSKFKYESSDFRYEEGEDDPRPDGVFRTLREVVTTVPRGRVATLPLPIQWLCSEDPSTPDGDREYLTQRGDDPRNECGDGLTCISGTCQDNEVDSDGLDEFDPDDPGLGGGGGGDGTCFDTLDCFRAAELVTPDYAVDESGSGLEITGCTLTVDDLDDLNVALYTGVRSTGEDADVAPMGGGSAGDAAMASPDAGVPPTAEPVGGEQTGAAASGGAPSAPATTEPPELPMASGGSAGVVDGAACVGNRCVDDLDCCAGALCIGDVCEPDTGFEDPVGGMPVAPGAGGASAGGEAMPPPADLPPQLKGTTQGGISPSAVGGVCFDDGVCLVPLDRGDGWTEGSRSGEIQLPPVVCRRIEQGRIQGVAISNSCESKTRAAPICGDWLDGGPVSTGNAPTTLVTIARPEGFVDDLSDGDTSFTLSTGERGAWIVAEGGSTMLPEVVEDDDSARGNVVRYSGTLEVAPEEASSVDDVRFVGLLLDERADGARNYDASAYDGIRFFARAAQDRMRLRVSAPPIELIPEELGGACAGECPVPSGYEIALTTDWREYTVTFDQLLSTAGYSKDRIGGIAFFPLDVGDFTLWLDDVQFVRGVGGGTTGTTPAGMTAAPNAVVGGTCDSTGRFDQLLADLEPLRECDPGVMDPCDIPVTFDGTFYMYVTEPELEGEAQVLYEQYLADLADCNIAGAGGATAGMFGAETRCIPTPEGGGVCSAPGSPYFRDPADGGGGAMGSTPNADSCGLLASDNQGVSNEVVGVPGAAGVYFFGDEESTMCVLSSEANSVCVAGIGADPGSDFVQYGAAFAYQMASTDSSGNVTSAFNASMQSIVALRLDVTGVDALPTPIRVQITMVDDEVVDYETYPFLYGFDTDNDIVFDGSYELPLLQFQQPTWTGLDVDDDGSPDEGVPLDPSRIHSVQVQVVTEPGTTSPYDLCVHNLQWLDASGRVVEPSPAITFQQASEGAPAGMGGASSGGASSGGTPAAAGGAGPVGGSGVGGGGF